MRAVLKATGAALGLSLLAGGALAVPVGLAPPSVPLAGVTPMTGPLITPQIGVNRALVNLGSTVDVVGSATFGADNAQRGQYCYGSFSLNTCVAPGTTAAPADIMWHTFLFGVNSFNVWAYSSGTTLPGNQKVEFADSNNSTIPFEIDLSGTWWSRQVASPVTGQTAAYTFQRTDCGTTIVDTGTSAHTDTVPTGLPTGCRISVEQGGTGAVTIAAASGMTAHYSTGAASAATTANQYATVKIFTDTVVTTTAPVPSATTYVVGATTP